MLHSRGGPGLAWNVVVTTYDEGYREAKRVLRQFGEFAATDYNNVLVMRVADPAALFDAFAQRVAREPGLLNFISRLVPATATFDFATAEEFERKAQEEALRLAPQLAGRGFHVRIHRRGMKQQISSHEEEQRIGRAVIDALAARGTPARAAFTDPDAVIVIETVDGRAGLSLWRREQLGLPFLRID